MARAAEGSSCVFIGTVATAAFLAACNGHGVSSAVMPTPLAVCASPPSQLEVLYPKPGAKNVSPSVSAAYVATSAALPAGNQYDFQVVQSNGVVQYTVNRLGQPSNGPGSGFFSVNAASIPSPHAKPSYPNGTYYATIFQYRIGLHQGVTLRWNVAGTGCAVDVTVSRFATGDSKPIHIP
jgi:hypothetical protein